MECARSAVVISAALPRVISPLRGGYIRPSGGLCFAAAGGKVNVCRGSRHISINRTHLGSILLTITAVALPLQNVPARWAHLNFAPKGVQNITRGFAADITAPRARYNFSPQAKNITEILRLAAVFHCGAAARRTHLNYSLFTVTYSLNSLP